MAKLSTAERVSGVGGAREQTKRATEWPFQNAIVMSRNRPRNFLWKLMKGHVQPIVSELVWYSLRHRFCWYIDICYSGYPLGLKALITVHRLVSVLLRKIKSFKIIKL